MRRTRTAPVQGTESIRPSSSHSASTRAKPQARFIDQGDLTGPSFAELRAGENDLSVAAPGAPRALGQLITINGRVLDESGRCRRWT